MKKILIIHPEGNTFNNPTLKCYVDMLVHSGHQVAIRYYPSVAPMPPGDNIELLPCSRRVRKLKQIYFEKFNFQILLALIVICEKFFKYKKFDFTIAIDQQGTIEAAMLRKLFDIPFVIFSFEIMFADETDSKNKKMEAKSSSSASHWIVQDSLRARMLQSENSLDLKKAFILPVASKGEGHLSQVRLRDLVGIPKHKKICIAIGSVAKWSMIDQVLEGIDQWPDDWAILIHERYGRTEITLDELGIDWRKHVGTKIFISSLKTDSVDDMSEILSGVDFGLAFYQADFKTKYTGKNLDHIGWASGKISTYLRYGIPIITNEIGEVSAAAKAHSFGLVVKKPQELGDVLKHGFSSDMRTNAKDFFLKNLDFRLYEKDLLSMLDQ